MNSIFKIYTIQGGSLNQEISSFVLDNFSEDVNIDCPKLIRWCCKSKIINRFFRVLKKEVPQMKRSLHNPKMKIESRTKDMSCFEFLETSSSLKKKTTLKKENIPLIDFASSMHSEKLKWMSEMHEKLSGNSTNSPPSNINASVKWVYGMRCRDMTRSFSYSNDKKERGTSEKIIYACSKIIVIFLHRLNEQRHYTQHKSEVSSLAVSKGNLVASGEGNCQVPSIHIWDINTLKLLCEFSGYHSNDISVLEFLKGDQLIASCSLRDDTPIYVFDRVKRCVAFSYRVDEMVRGILPVVFFGKEGRSQEQNFERSVGRNSIVSKKSLNTQENITSQIEGNFLIFSRTKFYYFNQSDLHSVLRSQDISKFERLSNTSITAAFVYYQNTTTTTANNLDDTFKESTRGHNISVISGHSDGKVILWSNFVPKKSLFNFESEIIDICFFPPYLAFATDSFKIMITTTKLDSVIKVIDLNMHSSSLYSLSIKNLVPTSKEIIVNTYGGDFIRITLYFDDQQTLKSKEKKIMQLAVLEGQVADMTLVEKDEERLCFICYDGSHSIGFSSENYDIVDYWTAKDLELSAIECAIIQDDVLIIAYGTSSGEVIIRENWTNEPNLIDLGIGCAINKLHFAHNLDYILVLSEDNSISTISQHKGRFTELNHRIPRSNNIYYSMNLDEDLSYLYLGNQKNEITCISMSGFRVKEDISEEQLINIRRGEFSFALIGKEEAISTDPVLLGNDLNYIVTSDLFGNIIIFKDIKMVKENCGIYCFGHSSKVKKILMTVSKKNLFSVGKEDNCLIEWSVDWQDTIATPNNKLINVIEGAIAKTDMEIQEQVITKREIEFCRGKEEENTLPNDNFIMARGYQNKHWNYLSYADHLQFEEDHLLSKRVPPVSIKLSHVYGVECFHRRKTVHYLHYHSISQSKALQKASNLKQTKQRLEEVPLHPHYLKEMLISKFSALPYDKTHKNCNRKIVYFTSRIAVIANIDKGSRKQSFYEGHRSRISCLVVHPSKMIVATGEAKHNPKIHIWSAISCNCIVMLDTFHEEGILNMAFSYDGFYLISVGLDRCFSIQIADWRSNNVIAHRFTASEPILDIAVNPYDRNKFATCGFRKVQIWELKGRSLSLEENIIIPQNINNGASYLICLSYIYYLLGDIVMTDLVVGNSFGDIGLVTCSKYIIMKKAAHRGMINCLRITDILTDHLVIVSCGEDECIKFWDTSFNLIKSYDLKKVSVGIKGSSINISAQSLDIHVCSPPPTLVIDGENTTGFEKQTPNMLICTRDGDIKELTLTFKYLGNRPDGQGDQPEDEAISIGDYMGISYHVTQISKSTHLTSKKLVFDVDPTNGFLFSTGTDLMLKRWNLSTHIEDSNQPEFLGDIPSEISFSRSKDYPLLAIGFRSGLVKLFNTQYEEVASVVKPGLAILRIIFSASSKYMVVSFLGLESSLGERDYPGGLVTIYEKRIILPEAEAEDDEQQERIEFHPIGEINFRNNDRKAKQVFGAYFLTFDKTEQYLVANFQIIDDNLNRDLEDKEKKLVIYNIKTQEQEKKNRDILKALRFDNFEFPNGLNVKRKVLESSSSGETLFVPTKLSISAMGDFGDWIVLGSVEGDLSITKKTVLYFPEDYSPEQIESTHFCQGKNYIGHAGPVDRITLSQNRLFTSGFNEEAIFEWAVEIGKNEWEFDLLNTKQDAEDLFLREIEKKEEYDKIINESLPLRNEIIELKQNIDNSMEPEIELELTKVIGRKAFNRRNNLFYTADNNLVFIAASLVVFMNIPPEGMELTAKNRGDFFIESFLDPDSHEKHSISPQISTFTLSHDLKYICIGTIQTKAKILSWEITSRTLTNSLILDDCCVVLNLCYSNDRTRIVCIALTKKYTQRVLLIEESSFQILASSELSYSAPIKMKGVHFLPKSASDFITIGIQHMSHWQVKGQNLTFRELPIENPNEIIQSAGVLHIEQERLKRTVNGVYVPIYDDSGNEIFPLEVGFLALIYLYGNLIITAGDDGYVVDYLVT